MLNETRHANCIASGGPIKCFTLDRVSFDVLLGPVQELLIKRMRIRILQSVPLLAKLSEAKLIKLASVMRVQAFADGQYIIRQGEEGSRFYIINEGEVVCTRKLDESAATVFNSTTAGGGGGVQEEALQGAGQPGEPRAHIVCGRPRGRENRGDAQRRSFRPRAQSHCCNFVLLGVEEKHLQACSWGAPGPSHEGSVRPFQPVGSRFGRLCSALYRAVAVARLGGGKLEPRWSVFTSGHCRPPCFAPKSTQDADFREMLRGGCRRGRCCLSSGSGPLSRAVAGWPFAFVQPGEGVADVHVR